MTGSPHSVFVNRMSKIRYIINNLECLSPAGLLRKFLLAVAYCLHGVPSFTPRGSSPATHSAEGLQSSVTAVNIVIYFFIVYILQQKFFNMSNCSYKFLQFFLYYLHLPMEIIYLVLNEQNHLLRSHIRQMQTPFLP